MAGSKKAMKVMKMPVKVQPKLAMKSMNKIAMKAMPPKIAKRPAALVRKKCLSQEQVASLLADWIRINQIHRK